ncbi:hypothetical protein L873DRAFT_1826672 [Choiromyces venosus 120613-1]|uniref:SUI1 domain-containing protein n=1 Tax=Choiromyces venosus 120613-1 TaxID=1336337 RepID=A0A3N4K2K8_9PEZI|nr:hypothetical protein L873DRAFT_1826672 [Choiromyces venosus 120613-1]
MLPRFSLLSTIVKQLAPLRSTDRRKLANQIIKDFGLTPPPPPPPPPPAPPPPAAADADVSGEATSENAEAAPKPPPPNAGEIALRNALLPDPSNSAKISTTHGPDLKSVTGTIYLTSDKPPLPLWIRMGSEEMFPTVYSLWRNPGVVPVVHTHAPVIERLCDGADLMIPGLVGPFPEEAKVGRIVGIASVERPGVPVAVGVCEVDVCALERVAGEKGKAVRVLHWVGDEIWKLGGGGVIPERLGGDDDDELEDLEDGIGGVSLEDADGKGKEVEVGNDDAGDGHEDIRELSTKEIDEAFHAAAMFGLHDHFDTGKFTSLSFPLTSSQFISTLVLPYLPPASSFPPRNLLQNTGPHPSLQMKKSSHKSAVKFLKLLDKEGYIKIKTRNGGEVVVMDVDWDNDEIKDFAPYDLPVPPKEPKKETSTATASGSTASGSIRVVELFRPNGKATTIFYDVGAGTKDFYTSAEVKAVMNKYLEKENLVSTTNKRLTKIDPNISNILLNTTLPEDREALKTGVTKRDYLGDKLLKSCSPYYRVLHPSADESSKPKSGAPPKVSLVIESRQGKKTVTKLSGLEPFGIDAKAAAEVLQRVCAGSASVGLLNGSSPKTPVMEIVLQGSQKKAVVEFLEKKGVVGKLLVVSDKTGGKKKK